MPKNQVSPMIAKTRIKRVDGEYIVRAYGIDGERLPDCDYFTDDRVDAEQTAAAMIADFNG